MTSQVTRPHLPLRQKTSHRPSEASSFMYPVDLRMKMITETVTRTQRMGMTLVLMLHRVMGTIEKLHTKIAVTGKMCTEGPILPDHLLDLPWAVYHQSIRVKESLIWETLRSEKDILRSIQIQIQTHQSRSPPHLQRLREVPPREDTKKSKI